MNGSAPLYRLHRIEKSFGSVQVLNAASCDVFAGEVHCLLGENGAGKSTLIKIMSGAYTPDAGTLDFEGREISHLTPSLARKLGISTIYQELDLIPNLTVAENISLGKEPRRSLGRVDTRKMRVVAETVLRDIGVSIPVDSQVHELGIAQQQMVAIAKSLLDESKVLILDEPTAVFTRSETEVLFRVVRDLKSRGRGIVLISHHLSEVFELADRITILRDGSVVDSGPLSKFTEDDVVRKMVGRSIDFRRHGRIQDRTEKPVLEVRNLSMGSRIQDVSFVVRPGEIVGIAGLVGSGRTRLARLIYGDEHPTSGEIVFNGVLLQGNSPSQSTARGMGMVPEDRKQDGLALYRPAGENLGYAYVNRKRRLGSVPWAAVKRGIQQQFDQLQVRPPRPALSAIRLSGGNQQKLVLGRWLLTGAKLLILDEPTRGVDVGARTEIYAILEKLRQEGTAIIMVSSDLPEILSQSDRILVMAQGRIVGELDADGASEEQVAALAFVKEQV